MGYKKVDPQHLGEHKVDIWFISFVTALFNFIPVFNIFGPYFVEIAMFHDLKHGKKGV